MILNVNISCSSWGIIGGFELFKASMKLRLINAAICDLGVHWGNYLFFLIGKTPIDMLYYC